MPVLFGVALGIADALLDRPAQADLAGEIPGTAGRVEAAAGGPHQLADRQALLAGPAREEPETSGVEGAVVLDRRDQAADAVRRQRVAVALAARDARVEPAELVEVDEGAVVAHLDVVRDAALHAQLPGERDHDHGPVLDLQLAGVRQRHDGEVGSQVPLSVFRDRRQSETDHDKAVAGSSPRHGSLDRH